MDTLIQSDRQHKNSESAMITLAKMDEELVQIKEQFKASPLAEAEQLNLFMAAMEQMTDIMKAVVSKGDKSQTDNKSGACHFIWLSASY